MTLHNPTHPGQIILHDCIEPLGLTIIEAAKALEITRQQLHRIIKGDSAVSAEMAERLSQAFGSTAETWLAMQARYDLMQIRKKHLVDIKKVIAKSESSPVAVANDTSKATKKAVNVYGRQVKSSAAKPSLKARGSKKRKTG